MIDIMIAMDMNGKEKLLTDTIRKLAASSNPLFYYAQSLKSPRSIYRWLAVWKI